MTNPNDPASPVQAKYLAELPTCAGLTKREHFAALAQAAILSNSAMKYDFEGSAEDAVEYADALIAALNAEVKP